MAFAWDIHHYPTQQSYAEALRPFAVPRWLQGSGAGLTIHHTWKPTPATWKGKRTMEALGRTYSAKGWSGGPHLFLAPDGIWSGTPLASPGVHAKACNRDHVGLEIVGDFDRDGWGMVLSEHVYALAVELLQWLRVDESRVQGHRECLNNKSCPGWAINMGTVRATLRQRLYNRRFVIEVDAARVRAEPRTDRATLMTLPWGSSVPATPVRGSAYQNDPRWVKVVLPSGRTGYIWQQLGRLERL